MDWYLEIAWLKEVYFTSDNKRVTAAAFEAVLTMITIRSEGGAR